jgi:hypothetical protein
MRVEDISSGTYRPSGYNLGVCKSFSSIRDGGESLSNSSFKSSVLIEAMIQDIRTSVIGWRMLSQTSDVKFNYFEGGS